MKKLAFVALFALVVAMVVSNCAFASASNNYDQSEEYKFVEQFCAQFANRASGTALQIQNGSVQAWLKDLFTQTVGEKGDVTIQSFEVGQSTYGHNIVATVNKNTSQKVIVGAHYDSVEQGANDNAVGVATLYFSMKQVVERYAQLPCTVVFVAFDAEEVGGLGSYEYVRQMTDVDKQNTLAFFNVDSIGSGDNLYVYCEGKPTQLQQLVLDNTFGATHKPYAKGTYPVPNLNNGLSYYDKMHNSDYTAFRVENIPCAMYFSGTYSASVWDYKESANVNKQTMNTNQDTFENLARYSGEQFVQRIATVSQSISQVVTSSNFVEIATITRQQLVNFDVAYNALWPTLTVAGLIVVCIILAISYYRKLQKRGILGTAQVKNNSVFDKPDVDDVFSFK